MKIGLNGQHILIENPAGPERFTINLYRALAEIDKVNTYTIYVNAQPSEQLIKSVTGNNRNFTFQVVKPTISWTQFDLSLELLKHPVDVFFTPMHTFPYLVLPTTKLVAMVHGLEYRTNKQLPQWSPRYLLQPIILWQLVLRAKKVITPSFATYNALIKTGWVNKDKLTIVNEGVSRVFRKYSPEKISEIKNKYGLEKNPYLMFISTIQPRKNIPSLIEAFANVIKNNKNLNDVILVISGKQGWNVEESINAPDKYNIRNNVRFIGWTPQDDIPMLLSGASGYTNFSFDEGFGLTVLEAMASGIPVACSAIDAHREVAGDLAEFANPYDVAEIETALTKILTAPDNHKIEKACQRAAEFSWENTARKTLELIENV